MSAVDAARAARNKQSVAGRVGDAAGALAAGRAAGRIDQSKMNNQQDQLAMLRARLEQERSNSENVFGMSKYNASANEANSHNAFNLNNAGVDLSRRQFQLEAPQARAKNSVRGDYLANAHNTTVSLPPGFAGGRAIHINRGFGPDNFSANTRALGGVMSSQALAGQQAGDQFDPINYVSPSEGLPNYVSAPQIPGLTPQPQANAFDKILTTAGTVGSLADTFGDVLARYKGAPAGQAQAPYGGDYGPATPPELQTRNEDWWNYLPGART
jgi:hypothetical protein